MNIIEAAKAMEAGKRVIRKVSNGDPDCVLSKYGEDYWYMSLDSLLAEDWEIFEDANDQ